MGWTRCFGCEKLQRDFVARTFALIAPVQYVLQQVSCSYESSQIHPNTTKRTETLVLGPMGWTRGFGCEKLQCDFVAHPFALIAPVQYVLQQVHAVTKRSQMHQNIMKRTKTLV